MKNLKMLMLVFTSFLLFPVESFSAEKAHFNQDVINIKEDAEILVRADKATVAMVIKYENESFENSIKECIKYREEIKNALYKAGFNDKEVKISNYSSIPVVGAFSGKLKKYKIENRIEINFNEEKKLTVLANIIDKYPYLEFRSILFAVNNKDSIKNELRRNIDDKIQIRKLEIENKYKSNLNLISIEENELLSDMYENREIKRYKSSFIEEESSEPAYDVSTFKISLEIIAGFRNIADKEVGAEK